MTAAIAAPTRWTQRSVNQREMTRSATRNQNAAEAALVLAASRLIRCATVGAMGSKVKTRPRSTKNGLPGGWGKPRVYAAAMYSLVSHMAVVGASVTI